MGSAAVVIYGRGDSLGNFAIFAQTLASDLRAKYSTDIFVEHILWRDDFFDYLVNPPFKHLHEIGELHIFSHSIGGGLFLAYGDHAAAGSRQSALDIVTLAKRRLTYGEVLAAERGAILTDDFIRAPYLSHRAKIQANLRKDASIKLWGCNAAVKNWVYSDNGVVDPSDSRVPYYWRALNERNVPKPSVAQAVADYFGRTCQGASSGAHIEVLHKGHWVSSAKYKAAVGQWPSGSFQHRLAPDTGAYRAYAPAP